MRTPRQIRAGSRLLALMALAYSICACAPIRSYQSLQQPVGVNLSAELGSSLFRIDRAHDLPNVSGHADIWGGKVSDGYIDLSFAGVAETGAVRFHLTDVSTTSDETTMSRYGSTQAYATTTTNGNISTTNVTIVRPPPGSTTTLPPNTIEFLYDPRTRPLVLRGIEVTVLGVSAYRCDYRLRDLRSPADGADTKLRPRTKGPIK